MSTSATPPPAVPAVHYTVFIKVPLERGDFVDPPDPRWTTDKDKDLWRILSSASKGKEIDWNGLADKFDVTLSFLLQQAAWLYERQLSQVREQLRRGNKPTSSASGPTVQLPEGGSALTLASHGMKRGGSTEAGAAQATALPGRQKRGSADAERDRSGPAPAREKDPYSRTASSTNTITQLARSSVTPQPPSVSAAPSPRSPPRPVHEPAFRRARPAERPASPAPSSPKASPSPPASSDEDDGPLQQSRAFARRPKFSAAKGKGKAKAKGRGLDAVADAEEDESSEDSGFLPFSTAPAAAGVRPQPRGAHAGHDGQVEDRAPHSQRVTDEPPRLVGKANTGQQPPPRTANPASSHSSGSPAQSQSQSQSDTLSLPPSQSPSESPSSTSNPPRTNTASQGPAESRSPLAALSPRHRRLAFARDGSDTGSPSMGSSFSDLDDASVSNSALEEALATDLRAGRPAGPGSGAASIGGLGQRVGGLWRTGMGGGR